jgi:putative alpha-1,2-mannosidase
VIECDRDPLAFPYIERVLLNGKEINRRFLTYGEITDGGRMQLILKKEP